MKNIDIFFSWQTDTNQGTAKQFLLKSLLTVKEDLKDVVDVSISEDMRDQIGSQDIADAVLEKIDKCAIFVADLTIVNRYNKENKTIERATPNPNVMYELGYAAKSIGWDRIICIMNIDYGTAEELPFDINHHSILRFSSNDVDNKNSVSKTLINAVKKIVKKCELPTKKAFDIGGFDFESNKIIPIIQHIDIDNIQAQIIDSYIQRIKFLYNKISKIVLPKSNGNNNSPITNPFSSDNSLFSLRGRYEQNNRTKCKIPDSNKKIITDIIFELFNIIVDDSFFELGDLESSIVIYDYYPSLFGTEEEKEKYGLIQDLIFRIGQYKILSNVFILLQKFVFFPIAIKNMSGKSDGEIELVITNENNEFVDPNEMFEPSDISLLSDFVYQNDVLEKLFTLKTNPNISSLVCFTNIDLTMPIGEDREMSNEEFLYYLTSFLCVPENTNYCKISIDSLRSQECVWCPSIIVCEKEKTGSQFFVKIISKHSDGDFSISLKTQ